MCSQADDPSVIDSFLEDEASVGERITGSSHRPDPVSLSSGNLMCRSCGRGVTQRRGQLVHFGRRLRRLQHV